MFHLCTHLYNFCICRVVSTRRAAFWGACRSAVLLLRQGRLTGRRCAAGVRQKPLAGTPSNQICREKCPGCVSVMWYQNFLLNYTQYSPLSWKSYSFVLSQHSVSVSMLAGRVAVNTIKKQNKNKTHLSVSQWYSELLCRDLHCYL